MVDFKFKGIHIYAMADAIQHEYNDAANRRKTRFVRNVEVRADFWDYSIWNDLTDLAFIKATTQYYMQCYWKRSSKDGMKIHLDKSLFQEDFRGDFTLKFAARQQKSVYSLHISIEEFGHKKHEAYLDAQEVIMLDIALAKAINLLQPAEDFNAPLY